MEWRLGYARARDYCPTCPFVVCAARRTPSGPKQAGSAVADMFRTMSAGRLPNLVSAGLRDDEKTAPDDPGSTFDGMAPPTNAGVRTRGASEIIVYAFEDLPKPSTGCNGAWRPTPACPRTSSAAVSRSPERRDLQRFESPNSRGVLRYHGECVGALIALRRTRPRPFVLEHASHRFVQRCISA